MKQIARNSFYNEKLKRIDILDDRFYFDLDNPNVYFPSTTTILDCYPKGYALEDWHKSVGYNADIILKKAGETGDHVHDGIHKYVNGKRLVFGEMVGDEFVTNYTLEEWKMLVKFVNFWTKYNPKLIASEVRVISEAHKLGCTIDLVFEMINDKGKQEIWQVDTKTSNYIHATHELQIAANSMAWNDVNPDYHIDRCAILHLKATTRGEDKSGKKIQGEGWQLKEFDRHYGDAFKVFKAVRVIWDNENPGVWEPKNVRLPSEMQLPAVTDEVIIS